MCQTAVSFGLEEMHHVGAEGQHAAGQAQRREGVKQERKKRRQGDIFHAHAILLPRAPTILLILPGREEHGNAMPTCDQRSGHRQRPHSHRTPGAQPEWTHHHDAHTSLTIRFPSSTPTLLNCDRLGQIARLIHVTTSAHRQVVSQ